MNADIINFYREWSAYTNPALYKETLRRTLPEEVSVLGALVRANILRRATFEEGNTGKNADLHLGDMRTLPWWRQPEDDLFPTAPAMLAELYRRDIRGLTFERALQDKLVLTARFVAVLLASILKAKGFSVRVRAGHASYLENGALGEVSVEHWILQYWHEKDLRWVNVDADGSECLKDTFNPYDLPEGKFDFPAEVWLRIRSGLVDPLHFSHTCGMRGALVVFWSLVYDFHALMCDEIPSFYRSRLGEPAYFNALSVPRLQKIDTLASLLVRPDEHFSEIQHLWEHDRDLRLLVGGAL